MKIVHSSIYIYLHKKIFRKTEFDKYFEYVFYVYGDDDQSFNDFNATMSKDDFLYLAFLE